MSGIALKNRLSQLLACLVAGCAGHTPPAGTPSEKLCSIIIQEEKVAGSPKEIVAQMNRLAKQYDLPTHQGVLIRFDPAVDSRCCNLSVFRRGEPLGHWLTNVAAACGSTIRVRGTDILIELVPISDKRTENLESQLPKGMSELCRSFRLKRGQERRELGNELFSLLPRSPITSNKDIGTGRLITYDYEHPNYKLFRRDIVFLLGEPDRNVNNERFYYSLQPDGTMLWELGVEFGKHEHAINPSLTGSLRK